MISGFIISRNIMVAERKNEFSFLDFYKKRFARLTPAALVVAVATIILSYEIFGSQRGYELLPSFLSASAWVSNIYFYLNLGYFDPISQSNPFLHFWSLSVEEQFYIFWPLLVVFLFKRSVAAYIALLLIGVCFSFWIFRLDPNAMFYIMPTRIFQFAAGGLIACLQVREIGQRLSGEVMAVILTVTGLAAVLAAAVMADGQYYYFGEAAVLPVVGATLMLVGIHSTFSRTVLGNPVFVWLGKRAYSLYLVHWPLIIFTSYYFGVNREPFHNILIFVIGIILADYLHRFVEQPFRIRELGPKTNRKLGYMAHVFVFVITVGVVLHLAKFGANAPSGNRVSQPQRPVITSFEQMDIPVMIDRAETERRRRGQVDRGCHLLDSTKGVEDFNTTICFSENPPGPKIMVLADSFGAETVALLENWVPTERIISAAGGGCPPYHPEAEENIFLTPECIEFNAFRLEELARRDDIVAVLLSTNWRYWSAKSFNQTVSDITALGKTVYVIGARPQFSENVAQLMATPRGPEVYQDLSRYLDYDFQTKNRDIETLTGQNDNVYFLDVAPYFCTDVCPGVTDDFDLIYIDLIHITPAFADRIADRLAVDEAEIVDRLKSQILSDD